MSRITAVHVFDTRPRLSSVFQFGNTRRHESSNIYVKVSTDDGVDGWGEACPVPQLTSQTAEELCAQIAYVAKNHLVERSTEDIPTILGTLSRWTRNAIFSRAALDTALLDLRARLLQVPLSDLLGGSRRRTLPVHGSVGWDEDPSKMADAAADQVAHYRILKTYLGRDALDADLGRLKEMRSRVPDEVEFLVDINKLWAEETFVAAAPVLRELGVTAIEQPTEHPSPVVFEAGATNELMIIWDESVLSPRDILSGGYVGRQGAINVGISRLGGPSTARAAVTVAEAMGLPVAVGSLVETGIGSVAGAHLASTVAELPLPSYLMGFLKYERQVTTPELSITDSSLCLPEGPGLGVSINEEAIADITASKDIIV